MYRYAIAFLGGTVCLPLLVSDLPATLWAWTLIPALALCLMWRRTLCAVALIGLANFWLQASVQLDNRLPATLEGKDITVVGTIDDIPSRQGRILRFPLRVTAIPDLPASIAFSARLRLSWYYPQHRPRVGERWRLRVRLKRPYGFRNPGGFDYEGWLFQQGIGATGYVRKQDAERLADASAYQPATWREQIYHHLRDEVVPLPGGEAVLALALGVRHAISQAQWRLYRVTGTSHLMAISGLHIGLVAGLLFGLTRLVWGRFPSLATRLAAPRAAALAAMVAALAYAALAGFSIPTQRALVMVWLVCAGLFWLRHVHPLNTLSLALIIVLMLDPFAVLSSGFWLSFTAVLLLVLFRQRIRRNNSATGRPRWLRLIQAQGLLSLGLLPLTLVSFHTAAWLSPLGNLFAIPWISLVVVPLTFLGLCVYVVAPAAATTIWMLAGHCYVGLEWVLLQLASLPMADVSVARPLWVAVLAVGGVILFLSVRDRKYQAVSAVMLLPLPLYPFATPPEGGVWVDVLDVGQGLAVVARTHDHTLVYDTGPRFASGLDTGEAVLIPFLQANGVKSLDTLIVSHGDNDHIGGAGSLLEAFQANRILTSRPEGLAPHAAAECHAGQGWEWEGVSFQLLHPAASDWSQQNNASCVLRITAGNGQRILLPGDIEAGAEYALLGRDRPQLRADILVAPHHGSHTSSTAGFITAVGPDSVIFPAGRRNRYGFPHPDILQRYREAGSSVRTTGCAGALHIRLGEPDGPRISPGYRLTNKRLWHWLDPGCGGRRAPERE